MTSIMLDAISYLLYYMASSAVVNFGVQFISAPSRICAHRPGDDADEANKLRLIAFGCVRLLQCSLLIGIVANPYLCLPASCCLVNDR